MAPLPASQLGRRAWLHLAAAAAVAACRGQDAPAARLRVRVCIDLWPGYYPLLFAEVDPQLAAEGVELQVLTPEDTDGMLARFTSGGCEGVAVALGDLITLEHGEADARVVLVSDESAGGDAIVGREPFAGASSLRGAKIGTNLGGFGELFVRELLSREGVSPTELSLVHVEAAKVPASLLAGTIDAGHCWEPYVSQAQAGGAQQWFSSAETPGLIPDVLALRGEFVTQHPAAVSSLCSAWFRGLARWQQDLEAGHALLAERLSVPAGSISLRGIKLLDRAENERLMNPASPRSLHSVCERYIDFFIERGMLRSRPQSTQLIASGIP